MKIEYHNQEKLYQLLSDSDGQRLLDVLCGGVGMYEARIMLTAEQGTQYEEEGNVFLDDLAYRAGEGQFREQIVERRCGISKH